MYFALNFIGTFLFVGLLFGLISAYIIDLNLSRTFYKKNKKYFATRKKFLTKIFGLVYDLTRKEPKLQKINMQIVEKVRKKAGMSVRDFLDRKKIGITRQTYYNLLENKHDPQVSTILKISKALNIPLSRLVK